ncbi:LOW QUALITY PROTEIN: UDP-glycosyltransferase UGT5-like [Atheta coriaria]|uniref:LOW QUALITY PROTEIN: UDP-glycosyltransferase UGT5-like n=1 Tax=Dalotia coriaria TaxID=877792 RepID=UPI0031F3D07D
MRSNAVLIFLTLGFCSCAIGSRILGLFPVPIRSHYVFYEKLLVALSSRGHTVDVITHFPSGETIKNFNELSVAGSMPTLENNISIADHDWKTIVHYALEFANMGNDACTSVLKHPLIQELKTPSKQYDLVITEMFVTDCLLPYAHIYKAPIIGISSTGIMPWADERMGNPDNPAYIPNYFLPLRGKLNFVEKCFSTMMNIASKAWYHVILTLPAEIRGREVFGDMPPIENIAKDTMLLLANRHFSLDDPRPLVPGVIEIGGMHIDAPKQITPEKLATFVENSKDGVVYFSMGTLINMRTFSPESLKTILQVFSTLKQNVVMKLPKDALDNLTQPKNVYIADTLPQLDVLCHPNTKLFITHGGLLSIQEAAYCGTPIIGMPFHPHQEVNVKNYVQDGGRPIDYSYLDATNFQDAINTVMNNETYKTHAVKLSNIFKDRLIPPLDAAVYWTEYAMKHGGQHIRSLSADLIIFEYLLIDIVVLGVALWLIGMYVFYMVLQFLQELFDRPPPPKYVKNEEKQSKND